MIFEKTVLGFYKQIAFSRCDGDRATFFFSPEDFEGLRYEGYTFRSQEGNTLQGYIYNYDNYSEGELVIFDHGFGAGHRSYMREIEVLCKMGYQVFSYDHTGCMESEGEGNLGMGGSLSDLRRALEAILSDEKFGGRRIFVIGHSRGGFAAMNVSKYYPNIEKTVVISGFTSVKALVDSFFSGLLALYRKPVMRLEEKTNENNVKADGIEALRSIKGKALLVYSANDKLATKRRQYDPLFAALSDKENVSFILEKNKGHNPTYTENAVRLLGEYLSKKAKLGKKIALASEAEMAEFINGFDWWTMTEQDPAIWNKIEAFLKG